MVQISKNLNNYYGFVFSLYSEESSGFATEKIKNSLGKKRRIRLQKENNERLAPACRWQVPAFV
jgi:hypothetical protein